MPRNTYGNTEGNNRTHIGVSDATTQRVRNNPRRQQNQLNAFKGANPGVVINMGARNEKQ